MSLAAPWPHASARGFFVWIRNCSDKICHSPCLEDVQNSICGRDLPTWASSQASKFKDFHNYSD
jgi:hypothetical protein